MNSKILYLNLNHIFFKHGNIMMLFALGPTFITCTYDLYIGRKKENINKNYFFDPK